MPNGPLGVTFSVGVGQEAEALRGSSGAPAASPVGLQPALSLRRRLCRLIVASAGRAEAGAPNSGLNCCPGGGRLPARPFACLDV